MLRPYKGVSPAIAAGCYIDQSAQIIGDVTIGENSSVWMNAVVRGDVYAIKIGKNSNVQDCSVLHGMRHKYGVTMGDWVTVGHSVTLHGCTIGDRCLIGMGSVILNNAKVGEGSIIAAGTVIPENTVIEPYSLWMGVPGKFSKKTDDEKTQQMILQYAKNYLDYTKQYLNEAGLDSTFAGHILSGSLDKELIVDFKDGQVLRLKIIAVDDVDRSFTFEYVPKREYAG